MARILQIRYVGFIKFTAALFLFWILPAIAGSGHQGLVYFNGLPVPGATVTATRGDTKHVAVTNLQGAYFFPDLTDGSWTIQVEMIGFEPMSRVVAIGSDQTETQWELRMLPFSEMKVEVIDPVPSGEANGFEPEEVDGLSGASVLPQKIEIDGTPAFALDRAQEKPPSIFADLTQEQLSARSADGFLINGSVNNSTTSPFARSAAFGNNRRGIRSLYNGSLSLLLNNSALDARPYSLTGLDITKPDYNRSQLSLNFGGPLIIPRLISQGPWFSLSYQRIRQRNVTICTARMPTIEERNGDISGIRDPLGQTIQIFDPETGLPFDDNIIPQHRISPQAASLLSLFPLPNSPDDGRYNYQIPIIDELHQDVFQGQISWSPISARFNYQRIRTDNSNAFGFVDKGRTSSLDMTVNYYRSFNRFLSLNLQYRFERRAGKTVPYFADRQNISGNMGIEGNNQDPENWGPPNLSFSNYENLTEAQHSFDRGQTNTATAAVMLNHKEHYIRIGVDYRRQQLNSLSQQDARGTFTFTGAAAGHDLAGFLLGIPDTSSIAFGNADKYFRASKYAAYINDNWRVSASLTLNIGIRWEYEAPFTELYGRLVNLDIPSGFEAVEPILASNPQGVLTGKDYSDSLIDPDKTGFQPRIGFAWRPLAASSLVVRGGYGLYRDTSVYLPIARQMSQQAPLSKSLRVANSPETPLTIADGFYIPPEDSVSTFAIDPDFRVAYSQNWQLSIQRDLPFSMQIVATYLGIKGSRIIQKSLPNTYPEGATSPCTACPSGFVYASSNGTSIRHAGTVQLRRRLGNGFMANLEYTFSKSLDDADINGALIAQNWLDLKAERALSNFDQRHVINLRAQYTSGAGIFGPGLLSGWKGLLLKEWTLAGQMTIGSGKPLTPVYPAVVPGTGNTGIRPSLTGASIKNAPAGFFLNPAAYKPPAPGEWGNAGRNSITGPNEFGLDVSLGRAFRLRDRYNIEFRLESSNILNHVTFLSWNSTISSSQFGLPDRTNPMRKVQAHLRVSF
jgi:hypothetical protein